MRSSDIPDPTAVPAYFSGYDNLKFQRDAQGVLELTMHTGGEELLWNEQTHEEFADAFHDISRDRANRVVILTGSGDAWLAKLDPAASPRFSDPLVWNRIFMDGAKMLENMLDIHAPIICALNGPARVHSELALLCDILIASERTVFQDRHLEWGPRPRRRRADRLAACAGTDAGPLFPPHGREDRRAEGAGAGRRQRSRAGRSANAPRPSLGGDAGVPLAAGSAL